MTPRPRKKGNTDLQDNVEPDKQGKTTYYRYKFPNGDRRSLGKDKQRAIKVAKALNEKLAQPDVVAAVGRLVGAHAVHTKKNPPIEVVIEEFREHFLPTKWKKPRTLNEIRIKLNKYLEMWSGQLIQSFETVQIARFLNTLTVDPYIKHRKLLEDLFGFAAHQGYITSNPVSLTLRKSDSQRQKKRLRHNWEAVETIYEASPIWMQNAIDIALSSLQRRGDITMLHRDDVDLEKNTIRILQNKTELYQNPIYIDIVMGPELRVVVLRCIKSDIPCPYLIHRRPFKSLGLAKTNKLHPFAVSDKYLSDTFREIRDSTGVYDHLEPEQRPTFHDLRAIGEWLYEKAGYSKEYINALGGWSSDRTREKYGEGHEMPVPKEVHAAISFPNLTRK